MSMLIVKISDISSYNFTVINIRCTPTFSAFSFDPSKLNAKSFLENYVKSLSLSNLTSIECNYSRTESVNSGNFQIKFWPIFTSTAMISSYYSANKSMDATGSMGAMGDKTSIYIASSQVLKLPYSTDCITSV